MPSNPDADEARAAEQWLQGADLAFLLCRGSHNFPKPKRGRGGELVLPKGYRARRERQGVYEVTETCTNCGTTRTYEEGSEVVFGSRGSRGGRRYHYDWPQGYRQPKGAAQYISNEDCRAEAWRWIGTELDKRAGEVPE
jgi:hypothetical protein